jgi:hypothetical protein
MADQGMGQPEQQVVQRPSVTRLVHYKDQNTGECDAALVVGIVNDIDMTVNLVVWDKNGVQNFVPNAYLGSGHGTWHWPERV